MLKTFLTILIIYFVLKYVTRLFSSVSQDQGRVENNHRQPNITVNKAPEKDRRRYNTDDAEYVEYEEVD